MARHYDEDDLRDAIEDQERRDAAIRKIITDAIQRQRRHWIWNLVSDVARAVFGHVIGGIVDRVVDFFFYRR